ncbi:Predicted ATPase [Micromonospora citrea]|uniref:Predicted ATPase n=1 Tax=Micromonospora citrea TaxID=47855 RepID=A0A1C6W2S5_9ACTN|nr:AAA family ATPase [Micromonospora citrea]SCL72838.1 Predicted ATPase [Micromonospora citrea]
MRRHVLTGAPGAGKTTLVDALRRRGWSVVAEASTDVIAAAQARGVAEPWRWPEFAEAVARLQRARQQAAEPQGGAWRDRDGGAPAQVYDRSPLCTLALARFLGRPVGPALVAEVTRVLREGVYQRQVFLVEPLGFVTRTAARRIGYAGSLAFARVHEEIYRAHGHELVVVPPGPVPVRVALLEAHLRRLASLPSDPCEGGAHPR